MFSGRFEDSLKTKMKITFIIWWTRKMWRAQFSPKLKNEDYKLPNSINMKIAFPNLVEDWRSEDHSQNCDCEETEDKWMCWEPLELNNKQCISSLTSMDNRQNCIRFYSITISLWSFSFTQLCKAKTLLLFVDME